jgi:molybdenum cofactor cytidylyltransferase
MMPTADGKTIGIILLAAGESSRLGKPKQLLAYAGKALLQHSLQVAGDSIAHPTIVVLGAHADIIKKEIDFNMAHVVINEAWQEGMASSIRCGLKLLMEIDPLSDGVILMVCDQPFTNSQLVNTLIQVHEKSGKPIIACSYSNTLGPPSLFHKGLFPELLQLKGDIGAKSIIRKYADEVEVVSFPKGSEDIDTRTEYQRLDKENKLRT